MSTAAETRDPVILLPLADPTNPFDNLAEFGVFEYFVSIVPTQYIDRYGRKVMTNQYSVNDYARAIKHGQGVPGIFIKYEFEPLTMTVRERATSFTQFLVRLAGILGGVWVCAGFGYRIGDRMLRLVTKMRTNEGEPSYAEYAKSYSSGYASRPSAVYDQGPGHRAPPYYGGGSSFNPTPSFTDGLREKSASAFSTMGIGASHRPTQSMQRGMATGA